MIQPHRTNVRRKGAATVELAIVLPALIALAAIGADLSRAVSAAIVVANAARSGAEYGAMHRFVEQTQPEWEERVREAAIEECEAEGTVPADAVEVEIATRLDASGLVVCEVTARFDFRKVMVLPFLPTSIPIERTATMRQIR